MYYIQIVQLNELLFCLIYANFLKTQLMTSVNAFVGAPLHLHILMFVISNMINRLHLDYISDRKYDSLAVSITAVATYINFNLHLLLPGDQISKCMTIC